MDDGNNWLDRGLASVANFGKNAAAVANTANTINKVIGNVAAPLSEEQQRQLLGTTPSWFQQFANPDSQQQYTPTSEDIINNVFENGLVNYNQPANSPQDISDTIMSQLSRFYDTAQDASSKLSENPEAVADIENFINGVNNNKPEQQKQQSNDLVGGFIKMITQPETAYASEENPQQNKKARLNLTTSAETAKNNIPKTEAKKQPVKKDLKKDTFEGNTISYSPSVFPGSEYLSPEDIAKQNKITLNGQTHTQGEWDNIRAHNDKRHAESSQKALDEALEHLNNREEFTPADLHALQGVANHMNERAQEKIDNGETDDTNFEITNWSPEEIARYLQRYDYRYDASPEARQKVFELTANNPVVNMFNPIDSVDELYDRYEDAMWRQSHSAEDDHLLQDTGAAQRHSQDVYDAANGQEPLYDKDYLQMIQSKGVQNAMKEMGLDDPAYSDWNYFRYNAPDELWALMTDAGFLPYYLSGDDAVDGLTYDIGENGRMTPESTQKVLDWLNKDENIFWLDRALANPDDQTWENFGLNWDEILNHLGFLTGGLTDENGNAPLSYVMNADDPEWNAKMTSLLKQWGFSDEDAELAKAGMSTQEANALALMVDLMGREGGLGKSPIGVGALNKGLEANNLPFRFGQNEENYSDPSKNKFESALESGYNLPSNIPNLDYLTGPMTTEPEIGKDKDYVDYYKDLPAYILSPEFNSSEDKYGIMSAEDYQDYMDALYKYNYATKFEPEEIVKEREDQPVHGKFYSNGTNDYYVNAIPGL